MEITRREILISIPIIILSIAIGYLIATTVHDKVTERNSPYFKALKVDDNVDIFNYSLQTKVGNVLSYGEFQADKPVADKMIEGKYSSIIRIKERYTMHTRVVSYKCGKSTCTRTENYWTWDEVDREKTHSETLTYLDNKIKFNDLRADSDHVRLKTVKESSSVRYKFNVIPEKFKGTLYTNSLTGDLVINDYFHGKNIEKVITDKEKEAENYTLIFWIVWILFVTLSVFGFYYAENKWLH